VLVVMDHFPRRLVGVGRALRRRCGRRRLPHVQRRHSWAGRTPTSQHRSRPGVRGAPLAANLRILEIDEVKTVPYVPRSIQSWRLIGTMRREFLDLVMFWNAHDLERKHAEGQVYHNAARSQSSLDGRTPLTFAGGHTVALADLRHVRWVSHCRDLGQLPLAA
jgi:hypothetical protein